MPDLIVERSHGVVVATLNRPARRNALTLSLFDELGALFEEVDADPEVGAVVLTGADATFCSGADLATRAAEDPAPGSSASIERIHRAALALHRRTTPVVAAVDGLAVGAGMSLAIGCDLVVATTRAKMCAIFVRRALSIDFGMSWLLPRRVGLARAKQIALLGEYLDAAQLLDLGLVCEVVEPDELLASATALARRLADGPRAAVRSDLELLDGSFERSFEAALAAEVEAQVRNASTDDAREAISAFLERREPRFGGR